MTAIHLVAALAALQWQAAHAGTKNASLSVSATVVRPAHISEPILTAEGTIVVIRNAEGVTVSVEGGERRYTRSGVTILIVDASASSTITLTY